MRMITTLAILLALCSFHAPAWAQDTDKEVRTQLRVSIQDRGLKFELYHDGKVELTVQEEDKATGKKTDKTYKADSLEEFKSKHPEVAKEHQIDRFIPRIRWGAFDRTSKKAWEEWKKWFEEDWFWDRGRDFGKWFRQWWDPFQSDDLDNWVEEQRKLFEEFRSLKQPRDLSGRSEGDSPMSGPAFGIRIDGVSEAVAAQFDLKPGEGATVMEVREGSPAHKAGLQKHDILLRLNGKPITDRSEFRKQIRELIGKEFELEILRTGRKQILKVKAESK